MMTRREMLHLMHAANHYLKALEDCANAGDEAAYVECQDISLATGQPPGSLRKKAAQFAEHLNRPQAWPTEQFCLYPDHLTSYRGGP